MEDSDPDSTGESGLAGSPDSVRQEAERLVATALGALRLAVAAVGPTAPEEASSGTGASVTDAADCAFCPLCRTIAALREPSPEFAERLATAAGDLAVGVTGLLRAFASATGTRAADGTTVAEPGVGRDTADEVWREATRTRHDSWPAPERDVPVAAPGADAEVQPGKAVPPADAAGPARVPQPSTPPEPAGAMPEQAQDATRRQVPASRVRRTKGAADDGPERRD